MNKFRLGLGLTVVVLLGLLVYIYSGADNRGGDQQGDGGGAGESGNGGGLKPDGAATEKLLQQMTLEEKVGQVIIAYFEGPTFTPAVAAILRELHPGGLILYSTTGNIESAAQTAALTGRIQRHARENNDVPLFIAVDEEGGMVSRMVGTTVFPGNMALGATGNAELAELGAAVTANELRLLGFNLNFAPVVDVNNNPANPVIGLRSFGSDPAEVARLGAAMVAPYREAGVIATAKHYPGHGDTSVDSHYGLPLINHDLNHLNRIELKPFRAMVEAGVPAVMAAHILMPALTGSETLPVTLSPQALGYLREELGFAGIIVTDSMSMGAISAHWGLEEATVAAFRAGADVLLFGPWSGTRPEDSRRVFSALRQAVDNGTIPAERLDQAVRRILSLKQEYRIIDDPLPHPEKLSMLASAANRAVARRIARGSITLVWNHFALIPLAATEKVPLIWPAEREVALAPLLRECPFLEPHLLPFNAPVAEAEALFRSVRGSATVLVGAYNLRSNPAWSGPLNELVAETRVVVVAPASPYDLMEVPGAAAGLATYSDSADSIQALGAVLNGTLTPRGRLPVADSSPLSP